MGIKGDCLVALLFFCYNKYVSKKNKIFLSVIVPTKNNKKDILMTLLDIHQHLKQQLYASEIIAIDDCSDDGTVKMVERYQELIPNLKLISNKVSAGRNFVVKQAILLAKGDWRLLLSPENHVSMIEFNKVIPYAQADHEIFTTNNNYFRCYSAFAAENIFTGLKRDRDYKIKEVAVRQASRRGLIASFFGL